jgi:hypothetical protein
MINRNILCLFALFLTGCAAYKELEPSPEIVPKEGQYQYLKNGDENFVLKKDNKYVVKFPRPEKNNFFLVLAGKNKPLLSSHLQNYFNAEVETTLTRSFGVKEGAIQKIFDENPASDSITVYTIDSMSTSYFWLIDTVKQETELALRYRYIHQWRYKFENEYNKYRQILADNTVDRTVYNAIDLNYNTDVIDFDHTIASANPKNKNLKSMNEDIGKLELIVPPDIKKGSDTVYSTYTTFRANVSEEILFQDNYLAVLTNLKKEIETRGDIVSFLKAAPGFIDLLSDPKRLPGRLSEKIKKIVSLRLYEILPFYDNLVKNSSDDIGSHHELEFVPELYKECSENLPNDLRNLITFFHTYNAERDALLAAEKNFADLNTMAEGLTGRPGKSFYSSALAVLEKTKNTLLGSEAGHVVKYGNYQCAVMLDRKNTSAAAFVESLTGQMKTLQMLDGKMEEIDAMFKQTSVWPSDNFYTTAGKVLEQIVSSLPSSQPVQVVPYSSSKIGVWAADRLTAETTRVKKLQLQYRVAEEVVPQINTLRTQENYRGIIKLLNESRSLGFLLAQFPDIDTLSLGRQTRMISNSLNNKQWGAAETGLDELFRDRDYLNPDAIAEKRNQNVKHYESELFQKVNLASRLSAETFVNTNVTTMKNVPALYKDSAFIPVYSLTFSSSGSNDLQQKKKQIDDYLTELKTLKFPETAIKALYKELTKNIRDQGVEKARAIVDHGTFYKGTDRQVKNLIAECDYTVPKVISKASEYRKVFVLPTTSNKKGENDYLVRLDIQIPSQAEFPVFDINITLPPELAKNTEQKAWFDEITINGKQIKNEGRFHITAPTSANNYESQITPVQLSKGSANILQIKLQANAFMAFEVSVMAQRPIIRK